MLIKQSIFSIYEHKIFIKFFFYYLWSALIRNWEAMIMLLQRESDAFATAYALSDQHTSIVLQLMLASVNRVKMLGAAGENVPEMTLLKEQLNKHLLSLLIRFQDSERHVFVLVSLLEFCDATKNAKTLQSYTKFGVDAFLRYRSEGILTKLAMLIRHWRDASSADKSSSHIVDDALGSAVASIITSIVLSADFIKEEVKFANNSKSTSKQKGRISSDKVCNHELLILLY